MSTTRLSPWSRLRPHPNEAAINAYADATLDAADARRIATHLIACPHCHAIVNDITKLRAEAAALPDIALPPTLEARVMARQASGDSVILPSGNVEPTARRPTTHLGSRVLAAAAALMLAALAAFTMAGRNASASSRTGSVRFFPTAPRDGDSVAIIYDAPPMFAHDSVLVARVRMQDTIERIPLRPRGGGRFVGMFVPRRAVSTAFVAIEDERAEQVDSRARRLWRVQSHDARGALTYAAALDATDETPGTTFVERLAAAKSLVHAFPDSIVAWRTLAFLEAVVHGVADSAAAVEHRARLAHFDSLARGKRDLVGDREAHLMWYARSLGDSARFAFWRAQLLRNHPRHPLAVQERAATAIDRYRKATTRRDGWVDALPVLDALWNDGGSVSTTLATFGFQLATAGGDSDALARWGPRYLTSNRGAPWVAYAVARAYTRHPSLRVEGMRMLRLQLQPVDSVRDPRRPLSQSVHDYSRANSELRGRILYQLGVALLAEHRAADARDTLRLAGEIGWNVERYRSLADASLQAGDTASAAQAFALVAADPVMPHGFADSALRRLGWRADDVRWDDAKRRAPDTLMARVLSGSVRQAIYGDSIGLRDARGRRQTFAEVAKGKVTVVAFGLTLTERSPVDLAEMDALSKTLRKSDMKLVTIALYPRPTDAAAKLRALQIGFDVHFDDAHEAQRAFQAYGFPMYFVVDAAGDIRFANSEKNQLLLQAHSLAPRRTAVVSQAAPR